VAESPQFKNEDEEREYWATHSAAEYIESAPAVEIEVQKPRRKKKQIGFRMYPEHLEALKKLAESKGLPYQVMMQMWIVERLTEEAPELVER